MENDARIRDDQKAYRALILRMQGGEDVHDQWDDNLAESLERELGARYAVR